MALARYTFGSLVRRGFQAGADAQATVTVVVDALEPDVHPVPMLVAGDVTAIPSRQVIRSYPRDGVTNAEPNYLALVEFDAPELPWLFSRPTPDGRTHPWVTLVVIDETELEGDPLSGSPLGTKLEIDSDQLPDLTEAYLWAHVQLLDSDTVPSDPARSLARLLSPRRLRPDRHYLACVVPTLESARMAGLGLDPGAVRTSSQSAWQSGAGTVTLPVYHWFRFATGPAGDFEALVRRLHGVPLPEGLGRRRVRLDHPLSGLPAPAPTGADLQLHVALRPTQDRTAPIVPLVGQPYLDVLKSRLADAGYDISLLVSDPDQLPVVGPPVYGQLPVGPTAKVTALGTAAVPPWLTDLNLDPRQRIAAGLGTEVVQRNQDHYLESAWRQVGDVLAANRLRRRAEYSLATSRRVYERVIRRLDDGDLVTLTAPVHAKIRIGPEQTLVGRLRASPVPPAVVSVEFRRWSRSRGALAHPTDWQASANVRQLADHAAEAMPLVSRVALDGVETLAPPSSIFDGPESLAVLQRLVPDAGAISPAEALSMLDAIAVAPEFTIPTGDEVRAALGANPPVVDRALSAAGFVPPSLLRAPAEPPADVEPLRTGGPRGLAGRVGGLGSVVRVLRSSVTSVVRRLPGGFLRSAAPSVEAAPARDRLRLDRAGTWMASSDADLGIGILRDDPSLLQQRGDVLSIDVDTLATRSRTGPAATQIDRTGLDQAVAGTYRPPSKVTRDFGLEAGRSAALAAEITSIAGRIADRVIRPGDVAQPERPGLQGGFAGLRDVILGAVDPMVTLPLAINSRIRALEDGESGSLTDIMAAPDLSEPTYRQLADISHDWLLPGLDQLPADTTTLVAANREFIEAFLVGMNHELARELLWHEYPSDQRASYARQFWSRRATATREEQFDLRRELHLAADLHLPELSGVGEDPLVLVVKGELIKRYPGVIICAAHTKIVDGVRSLDEASVVQPDFFGTLEPDVALVGFTKLTESKVREAAANADQAWWFFFAEHFAEPRFGFDELVQDGVELGPDEHVAWTAQGRSWNDAAWQYATLTRGFLSATSFDGQDLPKGLGGGAAPKHRWAADAASQAWITLQFPFRRGIPAIDLLPPVDQP